MASSDRGPQVTSGALAVHTGELAVLQKFRTPGAERSPHPMARTWNWFRAQMSRKRTRLEMDRVYCKTEDILPDESSC